VDVVLEVGSGEFRARHLADDGERVLSQIRVCSSRCFTDHCATRGGRWVGVVGDQMCALRSASSVGTDRRSRSTMSCSFLIAAACPWPRCPSAGGAPPTGSASSRHHGRVHPHAEIELQDVAVVGVLRCLAYRLSHCASAERRTQHQPGNLREDLCRGLGKRSLRPGQRSGTFCRTGAPRDCYGSEG
jgi:hypothetical protein